MGITQVRLENFTVFDRLELAPSPGVNVLVGANGTGKTHLLKVCYAACDVSKTQDPFSAKLVKVFLPSGPGDKKLGRLIARGNDSQTANIAIFRGDSRIEALISSNPGNPLYPYFGSVSGWWGSPIESVYIPAKEMLSNAPGFLSLYAAREVHFEEVYRDVLHRAYLPAVRRLDGARAGMLKVLERAVGGEVVVRGEEFFLSDGDGELEFTLLAEGLRKLGLLWLLIRNGALPPGSALFWDEPEANLNPKLYGTVVEVLLELQRAGVQVFLATHDYVALRELDLQAKECDKVAFHSLYRTDAGEIACHSADSFLKMHQTAIGEAFDSIYDRVVTRSLQGVGE